MTARDPKPGRRSVRLPPDLTEWLSRESHRRRTTEAEVMRQAIIRAMRAKVAR